MPIAKKLVNVVLLYSFAEKSLKNSVRAVPSTLKKSLDRHEVLRITLTDVIIEIQWRAVHIGRIFGLILWSYDRIG